VEQFSTELAEVDPVRLRIDFEFLKTLKPNINENEARKKLYEIYKKIDVALKRWIETTDKGGLAQE